MLRLSEVTSASLSKCQVNSVKGLCGEKSEAVEQTSNLFILTIKKKMF